MVYDAGDEERACRSTDRRSSLEQACRLILRAIGDDPSREGLRDTPRRFADAWLAFADFDPGRLATSFDRVDSDQMVIVRGVRVWSFCEHHLLPFWCDVAIGYLPAARVLGLSKFVRIAQAHAHRLQTQERLVAGIADDICRLSGSADVAVVADGEHLCMTMRGVRTPGRMTTSVMRGAFRADGPARAEFLRLERQPITDR